MSEICASVAIAELLKRMYVTERKYFTRLARPSNMSREDLAGELICEMLLEKKLGVFVPDDYMTPADRVPTAPTNELRTNGRQRTPQAKSQAKRRPKTLTGKAR